MPFDTYYAIHREKITRIARHFTRPSETTHDDYVSVMTERLWILYDGGYTDEGMVFNSLRYAAIDLYRKLRSRRQRMEAYERSTLTEPAAESVEDSVISRATIAELIDRCPSERARVVANAYYRGATVSEIGEDHGIHHEIVRRSFQLLRKLAG
ncbi:sigma-70 family RNA polymerase sigma factor [Cohnella sp. GCM10020058]|uniref:sigma-70 family RNA polymerase sigma factor n=1 Tax=Cohnella sp. GCM10020058 TaxID=3317330 RepID=UPI00362E6FB0